MHGRRLAATDSPEAAPHSWGLYANLGTRYWYTRVLQWLSQVQVLRCAQDDKAVRVLPFGFAPQDDAVSRMISAVPPRCRPVPPPQSRGLSGTGRTTPDTAAAGPSCSSGS